MNKHREFTRSELYELVWSTPMTKLAKQFGLSDVGLRKICVKHDIPTPPLGYWAKLNFGKPVEQTPLGEPGENVRDRVLIAVSATTDLPEAVVAAEIEANRLNSVPVLVPTESPKRLHAVAQNIARALKSTKANDDQFIHIQGSGLIAGTIGRESITRTVLILDTLFKCLEERGHTIQTAQDGIDLIVSGERLRISVGETKDKLAHQPTKAELKAHADWQENRVKWPTLYDSDRRHWRAWDHLPSGRLSLTLTDARRFSWQPGHLLGRWHDRKSGRLQDVLADILIAMHTGAALARHNRLADEEEERRRKEAAQARELELRRQQRIAQLDKFIGVKADELARLQQIQLFRAHLHSLVSLHSSGELQVVLTAADDLIDRLTVTLSADSICDDAPFANDQEDYREGNYENSED